jgi:hypothetical protein
VAVPATVPEIQATAVPAELPWDGKPDTHHTSKLDYALETHLLDRWRHKRGVMARNQLMVAYLPMVDFAAHKYSEFMINRNDQRGIALDEMTRIMQKMPDEGFGCKGSLFALHKYMRTNMSGMILEAIRHQFRASSGYAAYTISLQQFNQRHKHHYEGTIMNDSGQRLYDRIEARHDLNHFLTASGLTLDERKVIENEVSGREQRDIAGSEGWTAAKAKSVKHRAMQKLTHAAHAPR